MNIPLKQKMIEKQILQVRVAQKLGIPEAVMSKIVNGWIPPSKETKAGIARVLRCSQKEIFPKTDAPQ